MVGQQLYIIMVLIGENVGAVVGIFVGDDVGDGVGSSVGESVSNLQLIYLFVSTEKMFLFPRSYIFCTI